MKRRKWQPDEKLAIVMEGLKDGSNVSELCRRHAISQTCYYRMRDQFLSRAKEFFTYGGQSQEVKLLSGRISELERIIGKLTIQNEILKKTEEMISR